MMLFAKIDDSKFNDTFSGTEILHVASNIEVNIIIIVLSQFMKVDNIYSTIVHVDITSNLFCVLTKCLLMFLRQNIIES